ncbi:MAG: winged helix-turn-helix domain-containing protein [Candidatus Nanopelagicales bacterium]
MRPVLTVLQDGTERSRQDVMAATVDSMDLSPEDLAERLRGGGSRARSRAHWAKRARSAYGWNLDGTRENMDVLWGTKS